MTSLPFDLLVKMALAFVPVCLFLVALQYLDSYKLVKLRRVLLMALAGCLTAVIGYAIHLVLVDAFQLSRVMLARITAPILEEALKAALIIAMIRARRVGFLVDAAIQGFAIGAGFALVENLYYMRALPDATPALWLIRGFGTAIMHGGTTAIFAIISKGLTQGLAKPKASAFVPGLLVAMLLHSAFNNFLLSPLLSTLFVLLTLPYLLAYFFQRSEKKLQSWLGAGFDLNNEVLRLINSGEFARSPIGLYLASLRQFYPGEVLVDMLCYLRIHTELSLRAKGVLMMRESGFPVKPDADTGEKLAELRHLEASIGRTAMTSLIPILRGSEQDLWQLEILEQK
jgi:protease PrsW